VSKPTFEQRLDVDQLARIVKFPEILCFLRKVFSLDERVTLVGYKVGSSSIEGGYKRGEIDVCTRKHMFIVTGNNYQLLHAAMAF